MNYRIILLAYYLIIFQLMEIWIKKEVCDWNGVEGPFIETEILCKRSTSKFNYQIYDDFQWKEVR